jgi:type I restriction enzyme S subunit
VSHYKPYPAYKDSGVEWLGRVPEHWAVKPIKLLVKDGSTISYGIVQPGDSLDEGVPFIQTTNMSSGDFDLANLQKTTAEIAAAFPRSRLAGGEVILGIRASIGAAFVVPKYLEGVNLSRGVARIDCSSQLLSRFLVPYLDSKSVDSYWQLAKQGSTFSEVSIATVKELSVPVPPLAEQTVISSHLDRETLRIDALIEKKTRFIELLREKRQALITHAVTKGFDPNVKMKDSGVEWLGEVPEHWVVKRLKFIANVQTGIAKGKDNSDKDTVEVPYLRVANVQDGYLDLEEVATIEVSSADVARYLLQPGDVLMNEGGDFDKLGRGHLWQGEIEPCIHQNHVFAVRPYGVLSEWLNTVSSSDFAQFYFMGRSKQSTNLASISSTNLMELPVPLPSESEQLQTLGRLRDRTFRLDTLLSQTKRSIELLRERRSALITAAVTGQIDLREAV